LKAIATAKLPTGTVTFLFTDIGGRPGCCTDCVASRARPSSRSTTLGIVLTVIYGWGLITRPHRQLLRMGMDSLTVLVLYAAGIAGLIAVTNH
jgi:hypothetical protein